jgi:integrase
MPSNRTPLTKTKIAKAVVPPGAAQIVLWDSVVSGFGVRCLSSGAKTFVYRYRPRGGGRNVDPRLMKIGACSALTLDDARRAAYVFAGAVARGEDPAQQRAEERRRSRATLGKLLAIAGPYERHLHERAFINAKTALSSLRRGLQDHMATDVADLSRVDLVAAIERLISVGNRGAAADLRKFARTFCEWAVAQGLAKFNPMAGLRAPGRTRQQRLRDVEDKGKALTDDELRKVWLAAQRLQDRAAAGAAVSGSFGGLVQIALLTGMRRGELAQLERDRHILSGERAVAARGINGERVHLPRNITKTAAAHDIPLTPLMRTVIAAQPRTLSPLLFPSRLTGGRLKNWFRLVAALQRDSGVDFQLHDLRRTFRTMLSRLGIAEDIAELAIGHQREALILKYNKDPMWAQRVTAFEKVSEHVASLLVAAGDEPGSNVVAMRRSDR